MLKIRFLVSLLLVGVFTLRSINISFAEEADWDWNWAEFERLKLLDTIGFYGLIQGEAVFVKGSLVLILDSLLLA